jgi:hypothetical protein
VRDLDDPANPYKDSYGPWDRWIMAHAAYPTFDEMKAYQNGTAPEGWIYLRPAVDHDGFLIPQLTELEGKLLEQSDYKAFRSRPDCVLTFSAAGTMDAAVLAELEQSKLALWAAKMPAIPEWLAAAPAKRAVVLPSGEVASYGPLGAGAGPIDAATWRFAADGTPEVYYRYSAAGEELGRTVPGQPWHELFTPGYTEQILLGTSAAGQIPVVLNGYTLALDPATMEVSRVYDYDGAELPATTPTGARSGGMVVELEGELLVKIASVQQK